MAIRYTKGPDSGGFTPIPSGTYDFRIIEEEAGVSRSGNPQHKVRFEVMDGPHAGRQLNQWFTFTVKAIWAWEALLSACGIEPTETGEEDEDGNEIMEVEVKLLVGSALTSDVSQKEWPEDSGQFNNRLNKLRPSEAYPNFDEDDEPEAETKAPEPEKEKAPHPTSGGRRRRRVSA